MSSDINLNNNQADCVKDRNQFGYIQYVNICTGKISRVDWGIGDWFITVFFTIIIVSLLVVAIRTFLYE